jgi:hypothetical protein
VRPTLNPPRLALLAGLTLTACATEHDPTAPTDDAEPRDVELDLEDDVCPMDRHIVWLDEPGPCDAVGAWEGERLFHAGTPWLEENPIALSGELATVCRYQWTNEDVEPTQLNVDTLYGQDEFADAGPDCEVIHPQSSAIRNDAITDVMDGDLQEAFLAAAGFMDTTAIGVVANNARTPVTVAIVDAEPTDDDNFRTYHGAAMTRMVETIACPHGPVGCAVDVVPVLALPRYLGGVDEVNGGHFGSFGDLAAGIREATARWRLANMTAVVPSRLVINLSVGWNHDVAIDLGGPGERAVMLAIESARCAGAIVIASSGSDDPMLPGGWEVLPSPTNLRCGDVGTPGNGGAGTYNPLVHSVGGLGLDSRSLSINRPGGRPRLAAIASHGVVGDPDPSTQVLTGTSVSSAAVSAMAALVWSFRRPLAPAAVMQAIYQNGTAPVDGGTAQYRLVGAQPQAIRHADACRALRGACGVGGNLCPASLDFTKCGWDGPSEDDLATSIAALGDEPMSPTPVLSQVKDCPIACDETGGMRTVRSVDTVVAACEETERHPHDIYLRPQPPTPLCMSCSITMPTTTNTARMDGSLNQEFNGMAVQSLVVDVLYDDGKLETLDYGDTVQLEPDKVTTIEMPDIRTDVQITSASVTIELDDRAPNTDVLIVDDKLSE